MIFVCLTYPIAASSEHVFPMNVRQLFLAFFWPKAAEAMNVVFMAPPAEWDSNDAMLSDLLLITVNNYC